MKISQMVRSAVVAAGLALANGAAAQGTLAVGLQLEPPHLDPTSAAAASIDRVVYANIFEGLTRFGPDGSVRPGLAESWEITSDGKTYTFHLRGGVRFHDGTEMDARDVKFSLDRARDSTSQNAQKELFAGIESVEVVDELTVRVILKAPDGGLLFSLAWADAVIVAPESITEIKHDPIGTGAFVFKGWVLGDRIELVKNPDYWGAPARLDRVTFKFINDPGAAITALTAGEIEAFPDFPALDILPQFDADPRFQVLVGATEGETTLSINNAKPPFDDLLVRRAISHAIDRQAVIDEAVSGRATAIGTHFAPYNPDYVDLTALSDYNPELARQLLIQAGYADGFTTTLKLPPPGYAQRAGAIIAAQLSQVGITVEITQLDWPQWRDQVFRGKNFGLTVVNHPEPVDIGIYADPDYYFQYDSAEFQALMAQLRAETDPAKRAFLLAAAQERIATDRVNGFLFQMPVITVARARLGGLWRDAPLQATDLTGVFWGE